MGSRHGWALLVLAVGCGKTDRNSEEASSDGDDAVDASGGAAGMSGSDSTPGTGNCSSFPIFPDADGDGVGALDPEAEPVEACIALGIPEGYAPLFGDCDDEDPERSPRTPEQFSDGIDSDCDGAEDPDPCYPSTEQASADDACADRATLSVVSVRECKGWCPRNSYAVIANRGEIPFSGGVEVRVFISALEEIDEATDEVVPLRTIRQLQLEAGEETDPILLGTLTGVSVARVRIVSDEICETESTSLNFHPALIDCYLE